MEEPTPIEGHSPTSAASEHSVDVASVLNQMWNENFTEDSQANSKPNPWRERIAGYHETLQANLQDGLEHVVHAKFTPRNVKQTGILSLLAHDLVGLVVDKFGGLGSMFMEQGGGRFYLTGLANDTTQTMFDPPRPGPGPLLDLGQRQITQMVDVWFSMHPLSFLVSKTLLLRELRDGTHDEVLLAVIVADACFSLEDDESVVRGHAMLRWATSQLQKTPLSTKVEQPGTAAVSLPSISTAQALMLLGWNSLCQYQVRRATCYIGLSGRMAGELKDQYSSRASAMATSRINGIDVFEVEKEIIAYLYWTTYTCTLWTFMQIGSNFAALLPTSLTSIFLPVDEKSSVLVRLDEVSDNFSTLQKQKSTIKEMWPLAHIASITAYIYALYPQEQDPSESVSTNFWQEAPLLALQRIQQGSTPQDMACLCREVHRVLMESIHLLNRQVAHQPSRSVVLAVYHTMAIHLLFPGVAPGTQLADQFGITAETIDRLISSASELINIYDHVCEQSREPLIMPSQARNSFPDIMCLALDSCARAMLFINGQKKSGALLMEAQVLQAYENRLAQLAKRLHAVSRSDALSSGGSIRLIKKHLKAVVQAYSNPASLSSSRTSLSPQYDGAQQAGSSSLSRTPSRSLSATSLSESDLLSTAPTTTGPGPSPFVNPKETTLLRPSSISRAPPNGNVAGLSHFTATTPFNAFASPPVPGSGRGGGHPKTAALGLADWSAGSGGKLQSVGEAGHSALSGVSSAAPEHMALLGMSAGDAQASWLQANQIMMDFDMSGPQIALPWDWSPTEMSHHF
ncbi:hypothetical protein ACHAQA_001982 [Verticillium albo-atrum]